MKIPKEAECRLATVLTGEDAGSHLLFRDRSLFYCESDLLREHALNLSKSEETGVLLIGGEEVLFERLGSQKRLIVCGCGYIGLALIGMAKKLDFCVTAIEDRLSFAGEAKKAGADEVLCKPFSEALDAIGSDPDTYFTVLTRGHRYDLDCLRSILRKRFAYLGMVGSKGRAAKAKEAMRAEGYDPEKIDALISPVGLPINAQTPEEIAVSILAQIIAVKNGSGAETTLPAELEEALVKDLPGILVTIISKRGAAPRDVGTRMLIRPDGTCIGTIGGGCAESDVQKRALLKLRQNDTTCEILEVSMTAEEAEEEGMVCGGIIRVFLENA